LLLPDAVYEAVVDLVRARLEKGEECVKFDCTISSTLIKTCGGFGQFLYIGAMKKSELNSLKVFRQHNGLARRADLLQAGIQSRTLGELVEQGKVERVSRGLFRLAEYEYSANVSLIEATKVVPGGIISLLSSLSFHELTTQNPIEVYLAVKRDSWRPRVQYPPIRVFAFSSEAFSAGVEKHKIDNHEVRVYSPAKTVCDCLKFRNKIGKDVAVEAMRDYLRRRDRDLEALRRYAKICRVKKLLSQYLEAMLVFWGHHTYFLI